MPTSINRPGRSSMRERGSGTPANTARPNNQVVRAKNASDAVRRVGGRAWRLVIAGDLFDFMSVVVEPTREMPAKNADERRRGIGRTTKAGVIRMKAICEAHRALLADLVAFARVGHAIDII